jgi:hypothetical protein
MPSCYVETIRKIKRWKNKTLLMTGAGSVAFASASPGEIQGYHDFLPGLQKQKFSSSPSLNISAMQRISFMIE